LDSRDGIAGSAPNVPDVAGAVRLLKLRANEQDDGYFATRRLGNVREFLRLYPRLSACMALTSHYPKGGGSVEEGGNADIDLWMNREARHPLTAELRTFLQQLDGSTRGFGP